MVECILDLDSIFGSLADPTRRDILQRVARAEHTVGELARCYNLTFAAVSKHLQVMEKAQLVTKRREGKKQMVALAPDALKSADEYLEQYRLMWQQRFNKLDSLIKE